jgi:hypothetical protein
MSKDNVLEDGERMQVPMFAMDAAMDGSWHRPGPRQMTPQARATLYEQKIAAYDAYQHYVENAWKGRDDTGPTGVGTHNMRGETGSIPPYGAYPYRPEAEGASCTLNGRPGRLVKEGNWLRCVPDDGSKDANFKRKLKRNARNQEEGEEEFERDACPLCGRSGDDDVEGATLTEINAALRRTSTHHESSPPQRFDGKSLDQIRAYHKKVTDQAYAQYEESLRASYK